MNKRSWTIVGALLIACAALAWLSPSFGPWAGIDEAVINKFAEQAGRQPREPYINLGQGDLQRFFFLLAGAVGGFVAGYQFRALFPPRGETGN